MAVKIKPTAVIEARLGIEPNGKVQKFFQEKCYQYMDKYIPMNEGHLRYENIDLTDPNYIVYNQPYASYQYRGMRQDGTHVVQNYTTAGTGPNWAEEMKSAEMNDLIQDVQDYINRGAK